MFFVTLISKSSTEIIITNGLALYVDPTYLYFIIPVQIINEKLKNDSSLLKSLFLIIKILGIFSVTIIASGDFNGDLRNYLNILTVNEHSENIGLYWYIMVEVALFINNLGLSLTY